MKREEQELLERTEEKENNEEKPQTEVDQQGDFLEDEFDREFWIKVIKIQLNVYAIIAMQKNLFRVGIL